MKNYKNHKRTILFILLSTSSFFLENNAYSMENEDNGQKIEIVKFVQRINKRIDEHAREIKDLKKERKKQILEGKKIEPLRVILTVGQSREGKSTLINFLAKKDLVLKMDDDESYQIHVKDNNELDGMKIGDEESTTNEPSYWYDELNGIVFYDFAGFDDTRDKNKHTALHEIQNAYSLYKVFTTFKKVKVLMPVAETSLSAKPPTNFIGLIKNLGNFFKSDIEKFGMSSCLVLTKAEKYKEGNKKLLNRLNGIAKNGKWNFNKESENLIETLSKISSQRAYFPAPSDDEGQDGELFLQGEEGEEVRRKIIEALQKTPIAEKISPTPTLTSKKGEKFVGSLIDEANQKLTNFIKENFVKGIYNYCNRIIDNPEKSITSISSLRKIFTDFKGELDDISSEDFKKFKEKIQTVVEVCKIDQVEFTNTINFIDFLFQMNPSIKAQDFLKNWVNNLTDVKKSIKKLGKKPKARWNQPGILQINGMLVGNSDIFDAIASRINEGKKETEESFKLDPPEDLNTLVINSKDNLLSKLERLQIFSLNTLWIDENTTSHGIYKSPGISSFEFIAPCWRVIGQKTMNIKGKDGEKGEDGEKGADGANHTVIGEAQPGQNGKPGKPGHAGGNGAHFYGKVGIEFNLKNLFIEKEGGKGGNGGKGGDGGKGGNGRDGDLTKITSRTDQCMFHMCHYNDKGTDGKEGGNTGQRGQKGFGGYPGKTIIEGRQSHIDSPYWKEEVCQKFGKLGNDGSSGEVGLGGNHGRDVNGGGGDINGQNIVTPHHLDRDPVKAKDGEIIEGCNAEGLEKPVEKELKKEEALQSYDIFYKEAEKRKNPFIRSFEYRKINSSQDESVEFLNKKTFDSPKNENPKQGCEEEKSHQPRVFGFPFLGENMEFLEEEVTGDGDCGYRALGTSRQEATELLLRNIHRPEIRNLIAPEIYDMLPQLPKNHPVVQLQAYQLNLAQQVNFAEPYQRICELLNDLFQRQEGERWNGDQLWEHCQQNLNSIQQNPQQSQSYEAFKLLRDGMQQNEEERMQFCSQQETVECYIKNFMQIPVLTYHEKYGDNNWLNYSSILMYNEFYRTNAINAIVRLLGKNLFIINKEEGIKHKYRITQSPVSKQNTIFLLHIGNYHFNKLIPQEVSNK